MSTSPITAITRDPGDPLRCPVVMSGIDRLAPSRLAEVYDSGWVRVTVNGIAAQVSYGRFDTLTSVASNLATAINAGGASVYVTASAGGSTITLQAKNAGAAGNSITLSAASASNDPADFGDGSFGGTASGATLTAGADAVNPVTIWDQGTLTLTLNTTPSFTASAPYGQSSNSTAAQVASALIGTGPTGLNRSGSPVSATTDGAGGITIHYGTPGAAGNGVTVAATSQSTQTQWSFSPPSITSSGTTLGNGLYASDVGNSPYVTLYQYDALGNLLRVEQHGNVTGTGCSSPPSSDATSPWRVRRFTYDSLSRLLTAHNPESGTICYGNWVSGQCVGGYDPDGNLLMKTSPAPNQTGAATQTISYCYDELHRVTKKDYQPHTFSLPACPITAPVVTYTYDQGTYGIGRLTSLTDQAGTGNYTYDLMGRVATEQRTIAGITKSIGYSYNLDGSLKSITYPGNRVVTYTYSSAARPLTASDTGGFRFTTNATYWPNAAPYQWWTPVIYLRTDLNNRLQIKGLYSDNGQVNSFYIDKTYNYGTQNNGNIMSIANNKDTSRTETFTYDALNRITAGWTTANTGAYSWGETYTIDAWGNLTMAPMSGKAQGGNFQCAGDNFNHANCLGYDAAGNVTSNTSPNQYVYDQENRISSTAGMTYAYDADGNRVEKSNGSTGTLYWYGSPGIIAESDLAGTLKSEYVFFNGKRVARVDLPVNTVHYYLSDHLNSTSMVVSATGSIEEESDYSPFGTEYPVTSSGTNHYKFTGKERDGESQLDYFGARYYSNGLGRFINADWSVLPVAVPYADFHNPQSLNLYSYVKNNPTTSHDKDGHSDLAYDGKNHTLTLYSKDGQEIGSWHANNLVASTATLRKLPNGTYKFQDTASAHHHPGNDSHGVPKDSSKGEYGQYGIFRLQPLKADGSTHEGVGVHSGREGVPDKSPGHGEGADHVTQGCVRTCDAAMHQITETAKTDPLNTLTVQNNRPPEQQQQPPKPESKKEESK